MVRGRPREFDAGNALDRVLAVFWRNGFDGASVQELAEAAGVSKPSLYAAYGNKEALYLASLRRYADEHIADRVARLESEPDGREALRQFMQATVDTYTDGSHPSGCLVVTGTTTSDSTAVPEAVRNALCASMRAAASAIEARLSRAQRDGQLSASADPASLAAYFNTVMAGLSVQAKAGADRDALLSVVEQVMRGWPAPP